MGIFTGRLSSARPFTGTGPLLFSLAGLLALPLGGCDGKKEGADPGIQLSKPKCDDDEGCAKGFICKPEGDKKYCFKGERTAEEKAKMKADKEAERKRKLEARKPSKPKDGESTLTVRLCPAFVNTINATGTIHAKHKETNRYHALHMSQELREEEWATEFTFPSLPLGKYNVWVDYGIVVKNRPDVVKLKCHEKAKPCEKEIVREMEVIAYDKSYKPGAKDKDGKPVYKDCDFVAE